MLKLVFTSSSKPICRQTCTLHSMRATWRTAVASWSIASLGNVRLHKQARVHCLTVYRYGLGFEGFVGFQGQQSSPMLPFSSHTYSSKQRHRAQGPHLLLSSTFQPASLQKPGPNKEVVRFDRINPLRVDNFGQKAAC